MRVPTEFLSPDDFEKFSNRIVEKRFNTNIIDFGEGPDGGIDGMDDSVNPTIIVQSKRYQSSTQPSKMIKLISEEVEKLEKLKDEKNFVNQFEYIVVTSASLNPDSRKKIRELKPEWIKSDEHIIDAGELEKLSNDTNYQDIFRQYNLLNGKLIQEIKQMQMEVLDLETELFFDDFDRHYFVETIASQAAYKTLMMNRLVFLTGQPGVGKTETSRYLGFLFSNRLDTSASVIQRSIEDVDEVVGLYSSAYKDENAVLLVIFDDFLGRNTFDKSEYYLNNVSKLVTLARRVDNLYLIFNSRTQILQTATQLNVEFGHYIEDLEDQNVTVDVSQFTDEEKALILRKNFEKEFHQNLENQTILSNYEQLREKETYLSIVKHKNYFPRLMEAIAREGRKEHADFGKYILDILTNPTKLYNEIFSRLTNDQQRFLYLFVSFNEYPIEFEKVENAFQKIQSEMGTIQDIIRVLEDSWVNLYHYDDGSMMLDFKNPSIFDYLFHRLNNDNYVKNQLIDNSIYLQQLRNLDFGKFQSAIISWKGFRDTDEFIGNKLLSIIRGDETYNRRLFLDFIYQFNGTFYTQGSKLNNFYSRDWTDLVYEIEISKKPSLKVDFLHELLYSEQNKHLVEKIFDEQVDIGKLGRSLSSLFDEVYSVDFDQNEVIDSGEEETGVNLFSEFMDVALMWIEREADNDPYYWVEQYFDNNYGVDVQDYIESSTELNSRVIEFYISEYVESVLTTTQLEALDFEKLEDNLRDIFDYGVSDYISDYIESRYGDEAEYETDYRNRSTRTISDILDRPLT
ncbi:TPA: restriction endonuclease [Streptococcus suis]|nr:restriction endonuclease [Streptococcus suis]